MLYLHRFINLKNENDKDNILNMPKKSIYILAIESSCDDTCAAVLSDNKVLSNCVSSQKIHAHYGGVVPEIASRAHQKNIIPVVDLALQEANIDKKKLDAVAFTQGPGLIGSLLVGGCFAKSLSLALRIPLLAVNHLQGHILSHFINCEEQIKPTFPFLCLIISGGHTQIVKVQDYFDMQVLGTTLDDAVGEAYDKSAKIMGFSYPGGPLIDHYAQQGKAIFKFTKPSVNPMDFSFSGLKTGFLYFIERQQKNNPNFIKENRNELCASLQKTITEILMEKIQNAVQHTGIKRVAIAGGVAANSEIRKQLQKKAQQKKWKVHIPKMTYTTDNAAMIGIAGYYKYLKKDFASLHISPKARMYF